MQQIENLDKRILNNLSITSISPSTLSLQKGNFFQKNIVHINLNI